MLNESLVLSVVNDDSSELVKRDHSLEELASEKSAEVGNADSSMRYCLWSGPKSYLPFGASLMDAFCADLGGLDVYSCLEETRKCSGDFSMYALGGRGDDLNLYEVSILQYYLI